MNATLRIARRDLRGGIRGFWVFLACLALGVAAIAAVGSVRKAISEGLAREGAVILGGDAELRLTYRAASAEERDWAEARSVALSEVVDFRSMVTLERGGERERALVQVKGVDAAWPLAGTAGLDPAIPLAEALAGRDGLPGAVAEPVLLDRLGIAPGDRIRLGRQDFVVMAALTREPDAGTAGFSLGPRVVVARAALADSGLLAPGTLYESALRLRVPAGADLDVLRAELRRDLPDSGIRWRDRRNGAPGIQTFVDRLGAFLVLVGLASLAVGGIGVSAAVRAYLEGKTGTIATLRTLGAGADTIFAVYLLQTGLLTLLGIAAGLLLGTGIPLLLAPLLAAQLPVPALFDVYAAPMLEAGLYGLLVALVFTLWPLARARDIRAAALFRDLAENARRWPAPVFVALVAGLVGLLVLLAAWFSGLWTLALWASGGVLVTLGALLLAARGVRWLARRLARSPLARGRPALRLALGAVAGPGGETAGAVLSLGLGLTVLAAVGQIDANLNRLVAEELPGRAPAYFFVDIQNDQLPAFRAEAEGFPGVSEVATAPMLRGIITHVKGVPSAEAPIDPSVSWAIRGDRGVTYSAAPPPGTRLTEGAWWPEDYRGPPLVSFSDEVGRGFGLKIGDEITVNVLGRDITAKVASLRVVDFREMGINFLMVFDPGVMQGAPHTHIATVYSEAEAEGPLLRALADPFPNVTAVRVRDAISRVTEALSDLATATRWGAGVVLLTGIVVLVGTAAAGEARRIYEAAVLKTVGATRGRILASFAIRSALLGGAAGAVAILAGAAAGWGVMVFVMEGTYAFEPVSALLVVLGGAAASLLAGLLFALRPLAARPARVLRARD